MRPAVYILLCAVGVSSFLTVGPSSKAKGSNSTLFLTNVRNKVELEPLACEDDTVDGDRTAPIQWLDGGTRRVQNKYFARGDCEYTFQNFYRPGDVLLNVTFEKQIAHFDDFSAWHRIKNSSGFWYYSSSLSTYNPGQPVRIEFNVDWNIVFGMTPPKGHCVTNVGVAMMPTTVPSFIGGSALG